jgi:alkyl hydroperoxide reductase subunit AhpF
MSLLKIYRGQALQQALAEIVWPVEVSYVAVDRPEPDTLAALDELQRLTPHLAVATRFEPETEADRIIVKSGQGGELVFVGPPVGAELAALVSAIVVAGRGDSGLSQPSRQALAALPGPVQVEVFTAPT